MSSRTARGPAFIKPRSKFRKWLPALLLLGAVGCLAGAFLQFRVSQTVRQATVILVLDASDSMDRTDVQPSRLEAAQSAARSFLDEIPKGFRVGLVTFAATPTVRVHPTADRSAVESSIDGITTQPDTAIGDGLATAVETMRDEWRTNGEGPAAVLLLTDGVDEVSEVSPLEAAERARSLGVPVFTVLLGTPIIDDQGVSNDGLLRRIARDTEARSFNPETAGELNRVYEGLGSTLSTELAVTDIGLPFLIGAGALGLLAAFALIRGIDAADWR